VNDAGEQLLTLAEIGATFMGLMFFLLLAFVNFTVLLMEIWQPVTEKTDG
jgi:hypothetical protein